MELSALVSQIRIYTINRGMMDSWLKLFEERILPIHRKLNIPVEAAWVNADRTEFIWVRSFSSAEEIPAKEAEYFASPERRALGDQPTSHVAKTEIRIIEKAFAS